MLSETPGFGIETKVAWRALLRLHSALSQDGTVSRLKRLAETVVAHSPGAVAEVHERMPVVLPDEAHAKWLDRDFTDGAGAIAFAREHAILEFEHYGVSDQINRPTTSDERLIQRT